MNGTRARRAMSQRRPARSSACASLSMTHGPAISTNGRPPPIVRLPSCNGVTERLYRPGWPSRSGRPTSQETTRRSAHPARLTDRHETLLRLVPMRRRDERGKERVRLRRLRLELGMELHGEIPRVSRKLGDLDELAVRRAAGDLQPVLVERALVQSVELVAVTMPLVDVGG